MVRAGVREAVLRAIFTCKGNFSRGIHATTSSEPVRIAPFKGDRAGAISISGDLEMSWAWRSSGEAEWRRRADVERRNVPRLIEMLETYQVPVTWATVGHLFLDSCERDSCGLAHASMPRPPQNRRWQGDWYVHDPCSDLKQAPNWYAPDLIRAIQASSVRHELGTHSFSHIDFSVETSSAELVRSELEACATAMEPFGARPKSLVFCHNLMGHHYAELLFELGIIAVRHRDRRVRLSYPERMPSGVYKIYESMNLRLAKHYDYAEKARIFIEEAIKRGAAYHLWFHPSDEWEVFENSFEPILRYINGFRQQGQIWVTTMGELAAYCEARERTKVTRVDSSDGMRVQLACDLDGDRFGYPEVTLIIAVPRPIKRVIVDGFVVEDDSVTIAANDRPGAMNVTLTVSCRARAVELKF